MKQLYIVNKNRIAYQLDRIKRYISKYTIYELISLIFAIIAIIMAAWFTLSFFDIVFNNLTTHTYQPWNIIIFLADKF